jgi:nucleoid DNA-binding protein
MAAKPKRAAKAATRRTTAKKKVVKKKAAAKKAAPAKRITAIKEAMNKTQMLTAIADQTELSKKDVQAVLGALSDIIEGHIKKNGVGYCNVPGLMKIKTVRKPATKARKGINPFTGEPTVFKAKPARTVVKVLPLKALKEMAG